MKLTDFGMLTDENIHPEVEIYLREAGFAVRSVRELCLDGSADTALLEYSVREQLIVVTHDSDFGTLAVREKAEVIGIVYLRPGSIDPQLTIGTIESLLGFDLDVTPPFLIVARRNDKEVVVRLRRLTG